MKKYLLLSIVLLFFARLGNSQNIAFICNAQSSCEECIQASPLCSWCAQSNFEGSRCYPTAENVNCTDTQDPHGAVQNTSDDSFTDLNQITPRRINITLRRGEPVTFNLSVRPAPNFPLDLYLLMDLSYSMRDDLDNLKGLGSEIAETIGNITTNFRLGFGSFVDKRVAPYVSTRTNRLNDPCLDGCDSPYSYRHITSLVNNSQEFNAGIQARRISGNLDSPEGGFDGFLQSIVCQDLIGWRETARRLLLYITDAGFHYAGDGKLGGAFVPHTGECLTGPQDGNTPIDYEEYFRLDYPSIGQIQQNLRRFDIIPIFAAVSNAQPFYTNLAAALEGAFVGTLASDSRNVVTLINDSYNNISQRILILPDNVQNIAFNITPVNCPTLDNDGNCDGLEIEQRADFDITLTLLQCTNDMTTQRDPISVRVLGFGTFEIQVTEICDCECEATGMPNSPECTNGNGTLVCGQCECNEGRFGEFCQCDNTGQTTAGNTTCPNGPNGLQCSGSGRGVCVCGTCECQQLTGGREFFGQACECDNFQCDRDPDTGLVCGGPEQGTCTCDGQCECLPSVLSGLQYTGSACDCSPDNNTCINSGFESNLICSNQGECICGECTCEQGYGGTYCEICTNASICQVPSCNDNLFCARCAANVTTDGCDECPPAIVMDDLETDIEINGITALPCDFRADECEYRYFVAIDEDGVTQPIVVEGNETCSSRVAPWIIAVSIIGGLLLIGALILIGIKLLLMLFDYIEVKRFMREVQDPSFRKNENPLFQSPNKEYKNPVYGK